MPEILQSFLAGRTLTVNVGNAASQPAPVGSGVPRGYVPGCNFISVYINNLPQTHSVSVHMYADDVTFRTPNPKLLLLVIENSKRWSDDWRIIITDDMRINLTLGKAGRHRFSINKCAT